jgi:hypothetical protein
MNELTAKIDTNAIVLDGATNIAEAVAALKRTIADLDVGLFDDVILEIDSNPRGQSHFRFRAYRRAGG